MGRKGTTIALTCIAVIGNVTALGMWGLVTAPLLLTFPYYLIWVDSKKPQDQQFRFYNSRFGKKL
jgi:hypothetical protein